MILSQQIYTQIITYREEKASPKEVNRTESVLPSDGDLGEDSQLGDAGNSRTGVVELVGADEGNETWRKHTRQFLFCCCSAASSHQVELLRQIWQREAEISVCSFEESL